MAPLSPSVRETRQQFCYEYYYLGLMSRGKASLTVEFCFGEEQPPSALAQLKKKEDDYARVLKKYKCKSIVRDLICLLYTSPSPRDS